MNILIATLYLPYPSVPHGGGRDLFGLIEALGRRHTLSVVSFADAKQAARANSLRPYVADLQIVRPAITPEQKLDSALRALRRGAWRDWGRRADREMRRAIADRVGPGRSDVLMCVWTHMGRYLDVAPPGVLRVLDEVDVRFLVEGAAGPTRRNAQRRQRELAYCRSADLVLTRSARDLDVLRQACPGLAGMVLPPLAHAAAFADIPPTGSQAARVLFVGAMERARNQAAVEWLAAEIWPQVRAAHPQAVLRIVGANPPPRVRSLAGVPGVEVSGWVPDLHAEYGQARVVVAPMRSEAGALNKVIDGLAAGRPVVATTLANAGVAAPPGAIRVADDAAAFARAIVRLIGCQDEWDRLAQAGRRFAQAAFDWPAAVSRFESTLSRALDQKGADQCPRPS